MTNDALYRELARHLDDLPGGFPATDSGVELRILRRLFSPAEARLALHLTLIPETARVVARRVSSPFAVAAAAEGCQACGACQRRCPMDALQVKTSGVVVDLLRCIGCGLCVSACPTRSLSLVRKPPSAQPEVPRSLMRNYLRLGRARGKLGVGTLARLQVKSKIDRLLS